MGVAVAIVGLLGASGCTSANRDADVASVPAPPSDVPVDISGSPTVQNIATDFGTMVVVAFPNGDYQTWFISKQDGRVTSLGHKTSIAANRSTDRMHIDYNSDIYTESRGGDGRGSSSSGTSEVILGPSPTPSAQ